jgi:phosphopantothenoylcysteine synthetase/decarboxylase
MNVLVTAGNTKVLIDRVRCLTNIFTGRTGTAIALHAHQRGHDVTFLTSRPEVIAEMAHHGAGLTCRWSVRRYDTFADLNNLMAVCLGQTPPDVVIHSAAVSDYLSAGVYAPAPGTRFDAVQSRWESQHAPPALLDRAAAKVKSDDAELWLRLARAPKLIDRVRPEWGFRGFLVKFKLEVGVSSAQLLEGAEQSRRQSAADLMVANTLDDMGQHAYLGPLDGHYQRIDRADLPRRLLDALEQMAKGKRDG